MNNATMMALGLAGLALSVCVLPLILFNTSREQAIASMTTTLINKLNDVHSELNVMHSELNIIHSDMHQMIESLSRQIKGTMARNPIPEEHSEAAKTPRQIHL
jgi:hypothetical protein